MKGVEEFCELYFSLFVNARRSSTDNQIFKTQERSRRLRVDLKEQFSAKDQFSHLDLDLDLNDQFSAKDSPGTTLRPVLCQRLTWDHTATSSLPKTHQGPHCDQFSAKDSPRIESSPRSRSKGPLNLIVHRRSSIITKHSR
jgi:hypothetical protein